MLRDGKMNVSMWHVAAFVEYIKTKDISMLDILLQDSNVYDLEKKRDRYDRLLFNLKKTGLTPETAIAFDSTEFVLVDGVHRLAYAISSGNKYVPVKLCKHILKYKNYVEYNILDDNIIMNLIPDKEKTKLYDLYMDCLSKVRTTLSFAFREKFWNESIVNILCNYGLIEDIIHNEELGICLVHIQMRKQRYYFKGNKLKSYYVDNIYRDIEQLYKKRIWGYLAPSVSESIIVDMYFENIDGNSAYDLGEFKLHQLFRIAQYDLL